MKAFQEFIDKELIKKDDKIDFIQIKNVLEKSQRCIKSAKLLINDDQENSYQLAYEAKNLIKRKVTKMAKEKKEEFEVKGEDLLKKIKELIREGNIRRITIKSEEGKTLIQIPLTLGVVGALLLPVWAAIGAIAAIVTKASITVERE